MIKREEVETWIKEQVKDITYDGTIDLSSTGYNDKFEEETIKKYYEGFLEDNDGFEKFSHYLENHTYNDIFIDQLTDYEYEIVNELEKRAYQKSGEFGEAFQKLADETYGAYEIVEEIGGATVDFDVASYIGTCRMNLILATKEELNKDLSSIEDFYNGKASEMIYGDGYGAETDNALNYIIRQQGYDVAETLHGLHEFYQADYEDGNVEIEDLNVSDFIKSVYETIDTTAMSDGLSLMAATVCVSASGQDLLDVLDNLSSKDETKGVEVDTKTSVGLFNSWHGSGGELDIRLEKPLEIPNNLIYSLQIEGSGKSEYGNWTVDEVCGLVSSVWTDGEIKPVDEISDNTIKSLYVSKNEIEAVNAEMKDFIEWGKEIEEQRKEERE